MRGPSSTAAQVSSHDVSIARINSARVLRSRSLALMITGILCKLATASAAGRVRQSSHMISASSPLSLVVAGTHAGGAEAEALVHRDRLVIGDPHLERERQARRRTSSKSWEISRVGDADAARRSGATATFIRCQTWS